MYEEVHQHNLTWPPSGHNATPPRRSSVIKTNGTIQNLQLQTQGQNVTHSLPQQNPHSVHVSPESSNARKFSAHSLVNANSNASNVVVLEQRDVNDVGINSANTVFNTKVENSFVSNVNVSPQNFSCQAAATPTVNTQFSSSSSSQQYINIPAKVVLSSGHGGHPAHQEVPCTSSSIQTTSGQNLHATGQIVNQDSQSVYYADQNTHVVGQNLHHSGQAVNTAVQNGHQSVPTVAYQAYDHTQVAVTNGALNNVQPTNAQFEGHAYEQGQINDYSQAPTYGGQTPTDYGQSMPGSYSNQQLTGQYTHSYNNRNV